MMVSLLLTFNAILMVWADALEAKHFIGGKTMDIIGQEEQTDRRSKIQIITFMYV